MSMYQTSMVFLVLSSAVSLCCSLLCLGSGQSYFIEWEIMSVNSCSVVMTLILDWMSFMFLSFVMFISSMVLYYSGEYMAGDKNMNRFMYLVLAFVMSMGFLIISPNLISILLGWDGLGLVSYALVIYYQNEKSANAGMLTALSNRVGDVAILLAISLMFVHGGWNFLFYVDGGLGFGEKEMLCGLVVLAAMTKSAQIPFSAWLPAAMAAPTPVSALVHSSTLVTAGVYLLIRFSPALEGMLSQSVLMLLSSLTMFMAGLGANFEYDLKKIIALSTLSQLGVMMSILSLGYADLAFFHLLAHALFKALLFMCAGAVIHSVKDYQDIRMMGGLVYHMPLTGMCMNLANLALCGTPFLAGFYSKDMILEVAFMSPINIIAFGLYALATGLTVCYTMRLIYYSLSGDFNLGNLYSVGDEAVVMTKPMMGLSCGAIFGGAFLSWLIFPCPYMICMTLGFKTLALSVSVVGGMIGYMLNLMAVNYSLNSLKSYGSTVFFGSMWFMPFLSTYGVSKSFLSSGGKYQSVGDMGWSEYYGGQGIYSAVSKGSSSLQVFQDNSMKVYMLSFLLWLIVLFFIMI
uniref:NADH-ubiquinone oxidoreductase chain 5 n=1 Tax=Metapenaeus ensis TaxID=32278 RepID=A0A0D5YAA8_METEN|nr:NADH dehydrogenase subunit 5 [Metapenaeus ensis]AKA27970.1 NADH dehydrogenase subunit 5 [Metapenaeus ensis]QID77071.1 NADH dehydrogenase subunit 5 [Metapenaeus ensis]